MNYKKLNKKMKIEGNVSILVNREYTTIEVRDDKARITFVRLQLTPEQLSAALSRLSNVECEVEVNKLDMVGKKHENKTLEFEIPDFGIPENLKISYLGDDEYLKKIAQSHLTDGWIADGYFGSKDSFFTKDGKKYARCTIRRWI